MQTRAAAQAEDRRLLAQLASTGTLKPIAPAPAAEPAPETARVLTLAEVAKQYLASYAVSRLKPSTRHGYKIAIERILVPKLGDLPVNEIRAPHVRELDADLVSRGLRATTRRNIQCILRSVLVRFAVEAGILSEPPSLPKLPKAGARVVRAPTTADLEAILLVSKPAHRLAFLLAAHAGLRAGEVRGLRWVDVNLDAGDLVVRQTICRGETSTPKSGSERVIPLTSKLREVLDAMKKTAGKTALVSLDARGKPWSEFALGNAFRRAAGRAKLEGWKFHALRHHFVTALFRAGAPAHAIQALAGHAELTTTQIYSHLTVADLRAAIGRLPS